VTELEIQICSACGVGLFPDRLRCPRCGNLQLHREPAGPGRVEEATRLHRTAVQHPSPIRIASVRLQAGPVVVARLDDGIGPGTDVRLELTPGGAVWARAHI
jgi:uncharacterized OB-fold protein